MSDNDEDMSNNDSMLNSVKTEPNDLLNESMEHHRSAFPAALLGIQSTLYIVHAPFLLISFTFLQNNRKYKSLIETPLNGIISGLNHGYNCKIFHS